MKKIASYALFTNHPVYGHREFYWQCLPGIVRAHHNIFPGWELRIHHDSSVNTDWGKKLRAYAKAKLVNLVYVEENIATCRSMLWRILPAWEDGNYVLCRDIDSLPCVKDRCAVEEFIASGKALHMMTDNPAHTGLMGGMIATSPRFKELCGFPDWESFLSKGSAMAQPSGGPDQILLNAEILPRFGGELCEHHFCGKDNPNEVLPTDISPELAEESKKLVPFLGCAGFDISEAIRIFDTFGNQKIARSIQRAEARAV